MQGQYHLLGVVLDGHELDPWQLADGPDRLRVGGVGLVALHEGANPVGRQQSHLMAKLHELAAPFVRTATGFHHDDTRLSIGKPRQHLRASV